MSSGAEVVRASTAAFNEGGIEACLRYMDPEVVWRGPEDWIESETFRGHDGLRQAAEIWSSNFDEFRWELDDVVEGAERVVALARQVGVSRQGGNTVEQRVALVIELRGGRMHRVWTHFDWDDGLEAAGLPRRG